MRAHVIPDFEKACISRPLCCQGVPLGFLGIDFGRPLLADVVRELPSAGWPVAGWAGSAAGELALARSPAGGRRVGTGPGVACPKSRRSGCEPAAPETEWFPGCPPGPFGRAAAACRASATSAA